MWQWIVQVSTCMNCCSHAPSNSGLSLSTLLCPYEDVFEAASQLVQSLTLGWA